MALHDVPRAEELVRAVIEVLESRVLAGLQGAERFDVLVGVRALRMVERELQLAHAQSVRYAEVLNRLDVEDEDELEREIVAGAWDGRLEPLISGLIEIAGMRLAVSNPGYDTMTRDEKGYVRWNA